MLHKIAHQLSMKIKTYFIKKQILVIIYLKAIENTLIFEQ